MSRRSSWRAYGHGVPPPPPARARPGSGGGGHPASVLGRCRQGLRRGPGPGRPPLRAAGAERDWSRVTAGQSRRGCNWQCRCIHGQGSHGAGTSVTVTSRRPRPAAAAAWLVTVKAAAVTVTAGTQWYDRSQPGSGTGPVTDRAAARQVTAASLGGPAPLVQLRRVRRRAGEPGARVTVSGPAPGTVWRRGLRPQSLIA